jgi:Putative transposase, YhgA-like
MAKAEELPHDFPDRAIRDALAQPGNLRELLGRVVPALADRLDYTRVEVVPPTFLLDDWRRRDSDLLLRLPFRDAAGEVLVCVLIEHQSTVDPAMPLRMLVYAVLFWERQWRTWEDGHKRGEPLRLTPVVPIVFHTGPEPWDAPHNLEDLFAGPAEFRPYVPRWATEWCDLPTMTPEDLLAGEAWWQALAVVRGEHIEWTAFRELFAQALSRLEGLADRESVRWHQLLKMVLYWGLYRRSRRERAELIELARASQKSVERQQEVTKMAEQIELNYEQEIILENRARGALEAVRRVLRRLLEERFGPLPPAVVLRLDAATLEQLEEAAARFPRLTSLDGLQL